MKDNQKSELLIAVLVQEIIETHSCCLLCNLLI